MFISTYIQGPGSQSPRGSHGHHGGVRRNLGLLCEQAFNLDRALSTQPHTIVIQVTKEPAVAPTRARKDV